MGGEPGRLPSPSTCAGLPSVRDRPFNDPPPAPRLDRQTVVSPLSGSNEIDKGDCPRGVGEPTRPVDDLHHKRRFGIQILILADELVAVGRDYTYIERDFDKAVAANRRAAELDPLDPGISARLGQVLSIFGRADEAIEQLKRLVRIDPSYMVAHLVLADAYARKGDTENAMTEVDRVMELSPGRAVAAAGMAVGFCVQAGDVARGRALLQELTERAESGYVCPFWLAVAHAAFGEMDRAFEYLGAAERDRDPNIFYITAVPRALGLQSDPRYAELMRTIGLGHLVGGGEAGADENPT